MTYELTDREGRVITTVEARGKREALAAARRRIGGLEQASARIRYLLHPEYGPLHVREATVIDD